MDMTVNGTGDVLLAVLVGAGLIVAIAATIHAMVTDGYRRVRTRAR